MSLSPGDPHSFSRPDLAIVTHSHLDLAVDFENHVLKGHVVLDVEKRGQTDSLILDIRGIVLLSIINLIDNMELEHRVNETGSLGSKLSIKLPKRSISRNTTHDKFKIKIEYQTSPNATALVWLSPEQTAGGKHQYLFSQCQTIHCRSVLPCQDTALVKSTFSAEIRVASKFTVLMSGLHEGVEHLDNNTSVHKFHQPKPIPSYLISIAVAVLTSREIGPRSKIWTEREVVDAAAYEFAETESVLKTAEEFCGPYIWDVYDLLILPPVFSNGGMENPGISFFSPTLMVGDRSLASLITHEIVHSWLGNLVTYANVEHLWLNEGFTVFMERKIIGKMFGDKMRHFESLKGLQVLKSLINSFGETSELTKLVPNLTGINPDEASSYIVYEKGQLFLYYLEDLLGGPEEFDPFIKSYIEHFKYKSIKTSVAKDYFYSYFANKTKLLDSVNWQDWLYGPGYPTVLPKFDDTLANNCTRLSDMWCSEKSVSAFSKDDIKYFSPGQSTYFLLDLVLRNCTLSIEQMRVMEDLYGYGNSRNIEIKYAWVRLCIKARWDDKVNEALSFVTTIGRLKLITPVYQDLYEWEEMRSRTIEAFMKNKDRMMYNGRISIANVLHVDENL